MFSKRCINYACEGKNWEHVIPHHAYQVNRSIIQNDISLLVKLMGVTCNNGKGDIPLPSSCAFYVFPFLPFHYLNSECYKSEKFLKNVVR
jgi:hypothetical protein